MTLEKSAYTNIALEAEFGVTLQQPIPAGATLKQITDAVDKIYPTLELHNLSLNSAPPHGPELVAKNCINCGVVLGAPLSRPKQHLTTDLKLVFDGTTVDSWPKLAWPEDILGALIWLAGELNRNGLALQPGELILTSALGPPRPVGSHHRAQATSSEFGSVSAKFI